MKRIRRLHQLTGILVGIAGGAVLVTGLLLHGNERFRASGPMNPGHEELVCGDCHLRAEGTLRQQLQAKVKWRLGLRRTSADFAFRDVDNRACLYCHERPDDRHPVFRFVEPRFAEARKAIAPQLCESCHVEHQGRRVAIEADYCSVCHRDLEVREDPIDVPHRILVADERWETCLGCHDFHGNHVRKTPVVLEDGIDSAAIAGYFATGPSPYTDLKKHVAKASRQTDAG